MSLVKQMKIRNILLYLTNNESTPKDEVKFDIIFWIAMTLTILIGIPALILNGSWGFAIISILWYIEAWDMLRHNRS